MFLTTAKREYFVERGERKNPMAAKEKEEKNPMTAKEKEEKLKKKTRKNGVAPVVMEAMTAED